MSQDNVDALRAVYAEWSRGNWRPKFDLYDPDMEWGWSPDFPGLAGVYRDPAERSQRLHDWLSPWENWRCEAEEYIAEGDWVVVLTRYRGRGKGGGVDVDQRGAHVWKMRDGKAVRLEIFADRTKAFQSGGLQDQAQAEPG
jgi:ketosteroid isomerase-like protein